MNCHLDYYDNGDIHFRNNEDVFIFKSFERKKKCLHAHNYIEIAYVASGEGFHTDGDSDYIVSKGDLFIINYDVPHCFYRYNDSSKPDLVIFNCGFKPQFIDKNLINCRDFYDVTHLLLFRSLFAEEGISKPFITIIGKENPEISILYEKMEQEYNLQEPGYIETLRAYVTILLIQISRLYRNENLNKESIKYQRRKVIKKVMQYINDHSTEDLKLDDLSDMAFLSNSYFSKLFKECTGLTITGYIQKTRIEEACRLIVQTEKKVSEIAVEVGYQDIKSFNMVFRRITGKTPSEYRKSCYMILSNPKRLS